MPGRAGACREPEPRLAGGGWTAEPEFKGAVEGGASGEERGRFR